MYLEQRHADSCSWQLSVPLTARRLSSRVGGNLGSADRQLAGGHLPSLLTAPLKTYNNLLFFSYRGSSVFFGKQTTAKQLEHTHWKLSNDSLKMKTISILKVCSDLSRWFSSSVIFVGSMTVIEKQFFPPKNISLKGTSI